MKIDFINDIESSGESTCEVHLLYTKDDKVQLSHSSAILDEGTDGLLSETIAHNNFKGKFPINAIVRKLHFCIETLEGLARVQSWE